MHHPHIHAFSGVSFTGYMNELRHDSPRLSYTHMHTYIHELPGVSYMSYLEVLITQDHLQYTTCMQLYSII